MSDPIIKDNPNSVSYAGILGGDIFDDSDPFGGIEPHRNSPDYKIWRRYYESKISMMTKQAGILKVVVNCETRGPNGQPMKMAGQKRDHFGTDHVVCCDHAMHQDPVHPAGVVMIPLKADGKQTDAIYLCPTCLNQLRREGWKKTYDKDVIFKLKCVKCFEETLAWLNMAHPGKLRILSQEI